VSLSGLKHNRRRLGSFHRVLLNSDRAKFQTPGEKWISISPCLAGQWLFINHFSPKVILFFPETFEFFDVEQNFARLTALAYLLPIVVAVQDSGVSGQFKSDHQRKFSDRPNFQVNA
jgi:hypothetical protein